MQRRILDLDYKLDYKFGVGHRLIGKLVDDGIFFIKRSG